MNKVSAESKSVRQLLSNVEYSIDFYQREYAWRRGHISELIADLTSNFNEIYSPDHDRAQVKHYPHYFLGTIITVTENQNRYIVDGQQRLTTLTLLLIHIHHLREAGMEDVTDVSPMILSSSYGSLSLNINVDERKDCMRSLYENGRFDLPNHASLSVRNLVNRYTDISSILRSAFDDHSLPYFVDWLIENVDFVEIEAYSGYDAFTVFETMNDRGLTLDPTDLLKGYLLANIRSDDTEWAHSSKEQAEQYWRRRLLEFYLIQEQPDEGNRFFIAWLRAKYAESRRDFEGIVSFQRWVRDNSERLGLNSSQDYYDYIANDIDRFAELYILMRKVALRLTRGREEIYYNAHNNFTLQYMLALSPVRLQDANDVAWQKIRLVTTFIDIFIARRMVNYQRITYNSVESMMFSLMRQIRNMDVDELREFLRKYLDGMYETFQRITEGGYSRFGLHGRNKAMVRYLLARMISWIDKESGKSSNFLTYTGVRGRPYEIEHIMSSRHEVVEYGYIPDEDEYQFRRNLFGALVLLPRGTNRSLGAATYEKKQQTYRGENLLAASLHPDTFRNNPDFTGFVRDSGIPLKSHSQFKETDLKERQELYRQICEKIWSPGRLNAI